MNAERKKSSLTPKRRQSPQVQMRTILVVLIIVSKYILVLNWIDKMKNLPVNEKHPLSTNPPRQEAHRRSKPHHSSYDSSEHSSEIDAILA